MEPQSVKHALDATAGAAAALAAASLLVLNWLTPLLTAIAAIMSIIWYSVRFYEWWRGR